MIPIKLIIEGLYSYQTKQTIDFTELTANHLFGIFGSVGSGKSSILEAITFALYGQTDRLNQSGDNRNYNMMNLKSDHLLIEFDFIAGTNNQLYRSITSAKRNSKRHEDVKKPERVLYKNTEGALTPITAEELEEAIGLSYDNFKRTIIIPQGKFQEFLQLGNTQRTRMMKDLFNLEKFELAPKVSLLQKENDAKLQYTQGQIESLKEISKEQLSQLLTDSKNIEQKTALLNNALQAKEKELSALDQLQQLFTQQKDKKEEQEKLFLQKEFFSEREQKLNDYQYCIEHFKSLYQTINIHKKRVAEFTENITRDQEKQKQTNQQFEETQKEYEICTLENEKADTLRKKADALLQVAKIKVYEEKVILSSERFKKGEQVLIHTSNKIETSEKEETTKETQLKQLKDRLPAIETISKAQNWFAEHKQIHQKTKDLSESIQQQETQTKQLINELKSSATHDLILSEWKQWGQKIEQQKAIIEFSATETTKKINELLVQQKLQNYALHLHNSEPCPLCGSIEHPNPIESTDLTEEINNLGKQHKQLLNSMKALNQKELLWNKVMSQHQQIENQLKDTKEKLASERTKEETHLQTKPKQYQTEEELKNDLLKTKAINDEIKKQEEELIRLKQNQKKLGEDKNKYQNALHDIKTEISNDQKAIELHKEHIADGTLEEFINTPSEQLIAKNKTLLQQIEDNKQAFEKKKKAYENLLLQLNSLKTTLDNNQKQLESEIQELSKVTEQLQKQVNESHFTHADKISEILKNTINITEERSAIEKYKSQLNVVAATLEKLNNEIDNKTYEQEKHEKLKLDVQNQKKELSDYLQQQGKIHNQITEIKTQLEKKEKLQTSLSQLQERAEDIKTMKRLFNQSGFVNYVSSVYLQNICAAANERFKVMTRQQLSLELNADNNFEVRDYLNEGKTRSVKTLSGGQTFQASLALALALSDNIQSRNQSKQNFFFLDEGFGSLDKQALEMVFSTLKGLRNENRIVGIISHVEELQQEIPNALYIRSNEEKGSAIKCSWEE